MGKCKGWRVDIGAHSLPVYCLGQMYTDINVKLSQNTDVWLCCHCLTPALYFLYHVCWIESFFQALTLAAVATAFHLKDRRKEGKKKRRMTYWIFMMPFVILNTSTEGSLTLLLILLTLHLPLLHRHIFTQPQHLSFKWFKNTHYFPVDWDNWKKSVLILHQSLLK